MFRKKHHAPADDKGVERKEVSHKPCLHGRLQPSIKCRCNSTELLVEFAVIKISEKTHYDSVFPMDAPNKLTSSSSAGGCELLG
ncbi:hypothetical protein RRG08_014315 [Elysia crispata]|uniref:Uncharacterized protein n=1 Tax=Elysia crispata TaxID=231223 RepID=A0AAE0Z1W3_9GAST|nr:hypothetical protein RRG08_014315 [Elysia crispata]